MWGQRCGLHITATTATPLAVRTGLALSHGSNVGLCCGGTAAKMSTNFGWVVSLWREDTRARIPFKLMSVEFVAFLAATASSSSLTMSVQACTMAACECTSVMLGTGDPGKNKGNIYIYNELTKIYIQNNLINVYFTLDHGKGRDHPMSAPTRPPSPIKITHFAATPAATVKSARHWSIHHLFLHPWLLT